MSIRTLIICTLASLTLAAASANAQTIYAVDSSRAFYSIDPLSGAKTLLCTVSANASTTAGLAYDRTANILYLTSTGNDSLFRLDPTNCNATLIGAYGDSTIVMHGLEYDDSTGDLYGASGGGGNFNFYKINKLTGAATVVGPMGVISFTNLGYNSDTNVMYATNSDTDSFYSVNRTTGALTLIGPLSGPTNPNGLAYDWNNHVMFMVDNSTDSLYKIDLGTGTANLIGSTGTGNLLGLAYVPEPASLALLLLGLPLVRRRR